MVASLRLNPIRPGEAVALEIWEDERPLAHIILEAPDLTDLLRGLSDARASMVDAVPGAIDPGTRGMAVLDPAWQMPAQHPEGHRALSLRHPGLGWLSYAFPLEQAAEIAVRLLDPAAPTQPLRPGAQANPFLQTFQVEITKHAAATLNNRKIEQEWLKRALFDPDNREPDPTDAELLRLYKRIPERDGRVLRVVVKPLPNGFRIVTAFFDRSRR